MNRTFGKANIGLIIVNNRVVELDPTIKVKIDANTGMNDIETKHHGTFKVQETKTRYRYGKTNIYIMAVRTAAKVPTIIPELMK